MAKLCPLCSGSSGNSTYISTAGGAFLVDAGASCKALLEGIEAVGGSISDIAAVAITHTHIDHTKGLKALLKKTGLPVAASTKTLERLVADGFIPEGARLIPADEGALSFGDISLTYFSTSHDCEGSGGYVITAPNGTRAAVCTDLGIVTDEVRRALSGSSAILLESNHDVNMLKSGPYPPHLKLRIMSESGHLSNNACASELPALVKGGTTRIVLGHLSLHNNMPSLALSAARSTLAGEGITAGQDCILTVAKPKLSEVTVF